MIPRTSKHSILVTPAGGVSFDASVRQHVVTTDQPEKAGGADAAPTPLEMLSVSLAACVALYVHRYCTEHELPTDDLAVELNPVWRQYPGRIGRIGRIGRFDVSVRLPDGIPAEHRDAIAEVARSCPVHATLSHAPEIQIHLEEPATTGAS